MHYSDSGKGIPFIFQHGLSSNRQQPQGILASMDQVRLISMDCPGHGAAPLPPGQKPSFRYYVDRLVELMDELKIEQAVFGGISMGSGISIQMALRFPERVKALVLVRPAWLDQDNPETLRILAKAAEYIPQKDGLSTFKQRADYQVIAQALPKAAESLIGVFAETQRPEIPIVLKSMVEDRPFESMEALKKIQQPSLVIANEDDPLHPYEMAEVIHKQLPNSQLEKVISRYIDNDQHSREVYQLVSKFIQTI